MVALFAWPSSFSAVGSGHFSDLRTLARRGRIALHAGFSTAMDGLAASYVSYPHAEAFTQVWETSSAIPGWLNERNAAVLFELIQQLHPQTIVEIGSYLGRSSVLMALGQQLAGVEKPRLITIDPHTGDRQQLERTGAPSLPSYGLFCNYVEAAGLSSVIESRVATSIEIGKEWSDQIDLLYVDGWHSFDAVLVDGRLFLPHLSPSGVAVFDDYKRYPEVAKAVDALDIEGTFHLWTQVFGQAIGGLESRPVPEIERVLRTGRIQWLSR